MTETKSKSIEKVSQSESVASRNGTPARLPGNLVSEGTPGFADVQSAAGNLAVQRLARRAAGNTPPQAGPATQTALRHSGSGAQLPSSVHVPMENAFHSDFSAVRIHDDAQASEASHELNAQAFTLGRDIYFGAGRYQPDTMQGRYLLAHELTHTIQQGQSSVASTVQSFQDISQPGDPLEQEAEATAQAVLSGVTTPNVGSGDVPMIQRFDLFGSSPPKTQRELIDAALASKEPADVKKIDDFGQASEKEKFDLIDILLNQFWVGPRDEYALEEIWNSFGDEVLAVGSAHFDVWKKCVDRGAELDNLKAVEKVKAKFKLDVKAIAINYLFTNREYVLSEIESLGLLKPEGEIQPEQEQAMQEIQEAAKKVDQAQKAQAQLRLIQVGYEYKPPPGEYNGPGPYEPPSGEYSEPTPMQEASFDPERPPQVGPKGDEQPPLATWQQVKDVYDKLTAVITGFSNAYPAIYALVGEDAAGGKVAQVAQDDPKKARAVIDQALRRVFQKIEEAVSKIDNDDIDYRDLIPIHSQLFEGMPAPSGTPWGDPLYKWIAEDIIGDYKAKEFWINLGLSTLAAAAFVVAELATAGSATFFIAAGVGLGIGALQAGKSWENYFNLALAAQTNVKPEMALVSRGQASAALVGAILNTAFFFIQAYGTVARGVQGIAGAAERAALKEAERKEVEQVAREAAEQVTQQAAARGLRAVNVNDIGVVFEKGARGVVAEVDEVAGIIQNVTANQATELRQLAEIAASRGTQSLEEVIPNFNNLPASVRLFLRTPSSHAFYKARFGTALQHMAEGALTESGATAQYGLIFRRGAVGGIPDVQMSLSNGTRAVLDWTTPGMAGKIGKYDANDVSFLIELLQPGP